MRLSDKAVQDFREIFVREFKKDISEEEARQRAESLMRLVLLLLRPVRLEQSTPIDDRSGIGTL
jgi:hypothetical protein